MEIWFAAHTVKMYENSQRNVKPTTNSAGDENIGSIFNFEWDSVL